MSMQSKWRPSSGFTDQMSFVRTLLSNALTLVRAVYIDQRTIK